MISSRNLAQRLSQPTLPDINEHPVYAIIADEHNMHCLGEPELDVWWESLSPEEKGAIYERDLDGATPLPPTSPEFQAIVAHIGASFDELRRRPFHLTAPRKELAHHG